MLTLHPSSIDSYLACGHAYRLRYVLGQRGRVSINTLLGHAFHKALHGDVAAFKYSRRFLSPYTLHDAACAHFRELHGKAGDRLNLRGEPPDQAYDDACKYLGNLINAYVRGVRNITSLEYEPTDTEIELNGRLETVSGAIHLSARVDILCGSVLWEFKAKRPKGNLYEGRYYGTIQINTYLMLMETAGFDKPSAKYVIVRGKDATVRAVELTPDIRTRTLLIIGAVADGIYKGVFLPAVQDETKSWVCEYCDYTHICAYTLYRKRFKGGIEIEN